MELLGLLILCFLRICQASYPERNCKVTRNSTVYQCGVLGRDPKEQPAAEPFPVANVTQCRDFALAAAIRTYPNRSPSFGFNRKKRTCALYESVLPDLIHDNSSATVFYQSECFTCGPPTCPLSYGENLLLNGNLQLGEGKIAAPWFQRTTTPGHSSSRAALSPVTMRQQVPLCDNSTYKIEFYYKDGRHGKQSGYSTFGVSFTTPEGDNPVGDGSSGVVYKNNNIWLRYVDLYNVPPRLEPSDKPFEVEVYAKAYKYIHILVDDVKLYAVDPVAVRTPLPGAMSEVVNGGFETGKLQPWTLEIDDYEGSLSVEVVSPGIASRHGLAIKNPGKTSNFLGIYQTIPVKLYTHYVLTFECNVTLHGEPSPKGKRIILETQPISDHGYRNNFKLFDFFTGGHYKLVYPLVVDGDRLEIRLSLSTDNGADFLLDNFQLREAYTGV